MRGLRTDLRGFDRPTWILFAGTFINRFGTFVFPFLIFYITAQGYSTTEAGLALAGYGAGAFAASTIGGLLADRVGRSNTIVVSMVGSAIAMMTLSQARGITAIVAAVTVAGLFAEMYRPASSALLADLIPPERRVTGFAVYRLAINLGSAAGLAIAGFVAGHSYFALFVIDAATSLLFAVVAFIALPAGSKSARKDEVSGEVRKAIVADRKFMLFLAASLFGSFVYFQAGVTLPLHVRDAGFSEAIYGLLTALNGVIVIALELPVTALTRTKDPKMVLVISNLLVGLGLALTGLFFTVPLLALSVAIWTMGEIVGAPVGSAYVAGLSPPHLRGRYQGVWGSTYSVSLLIAPLVGTLVYAAKPEALWALCGVLGVASAACIAAGRNPEALVIGTVEDSGQESTANPANKA